MNGTRSLGSRTSFSLRLSAALALVGALNAGCSSDDEACPQSNGALDLTVSAEVRDDTGGPTRCVDAEITIYPASSSATPSDAGTVPIPTDVQSIAKKSTAGDHVDFALPAGDYVACTGIPTIDRCGPVHLDGKHVYGLFVFGEVPKFWEIKN